MKINPYLKTLTCLYVEDDDFIRESFLLMIKRYFKEVISASNGKEGLELFKKYDPDIVISDIRMPVMDGIEMVKKIKEIDPDTFVILITAFSDTEYLKAAIELGVEAYITKPVDRNILIKKLNFLAELIKAKKEKEELLKVLQIIFDKQIEGLILYEDNIPKLCNNKFLDFFKECMELDKLVSMLKLDLNKSIQNIEYQSKVYKVNFYEIENYKIFSFEDITEFTEEMYVDELTQVYNRKYLNVFINSVRGELCIILLDIDHFKNINDTYGHIFGDFVLKELANLLKKNIRKDDIIIRMGGEEFLIILKEVNNIENAKAVAEKLRKEVENYSFKDKNITISLGVCCKRIDKDEFNNLYDAADKALYRAKESGRNNVKTC